MDLIVWLITGLVAGVLALFAIFRTIPREPTGWLGALVVGLIGGLIGGWVADIVGLDSVTWLASLIVAFLGAVLILWLMRRATERRV